MNDSFDWDDDNTEENNSPNVLPKQLRQMYEKQKEEKKALESQLAELTGRVRKAELSKTFTSKGLPEKAMDLFPKDVDPTEETVSKWISDYGDLFGHQKEATTQEEKKETVNPQRENIEALNQMREVANSGTPAIGEKDYASKMYDPSFCDEVPFDEFKNWLRSQGAQVK